jgi:hypothetical protein
MSNTTPGIVNGQSVTLDTNTGQPTAKPTAKVAAGIVTAGALVVVEAAITAITPDLFSGLGPWGGVVFAGVVGLGGFLASYIKRP